MTIGPWNPKAAGTTARGRLRASDADREEAIDTLKAAFVRGLLAKDEFDRRAGEALASRTYADLAAATAGINAKPVQAPPPPKRAETPARRTAGKKAAVWAACVVISLPALGAAFLTYYGGFLVLFLFAFIGYTVAAKT